MVDIERGKLVVVEGNDGSGKGTQIAPLEEYFRVHNYPYAVIDFPQYKDNIYGRTVKEYLNGEFGALMDVHPKLASLPYAGDRLEAKPKIEQWLQEGRIVIANRYRQSNEAFQSAKLPFDQRKAFLEWLEELELRTNRIPKEDLVVLLKVLPDVSFNKIEEKGAREYLGDQVRDIHEADPDYQTTVAGAYLWLAQNNPHWRVVDCMKDNGMKPKEEITELILDVLRAEKIVK